MKLKPIRTELEYDEALLAVSPYFDLGPLAGSPQADHFVRLVMLVDAYKVKHYPVLPPDQNEAIQFRVEQEEPTSELVL